MEFRLCSRKRISLGPTAGKSGVSKLPFVISRAVSTIDRTGCTNDRTIMTIAKV